MLTTDTLICEVTPGSVEPTSLSCSVPPLEHLELWTTLGSLATAAFTLALVIAAVWAGRIAVNTLRQMKADSIAQTRPYVTASILPGMTGKARYDLAIENSGKSTARNMKITCTPDPSEIVDDQYALALSNLFSMTHTLHPGMRLRNFWQLAFVKGTSRPDGSTMPRGMPTDGVITIEYQDSENRVYRDEFELSTRIYGMAPAPQSGGAPGSKLSDDQKDTHKMLGLIAYALGENRR